ncbi:MAG: type II secretion system F family protein [Candidatus Poseidoniaceae archaeon]|jgi:flagellar protein FlaJ|nr:type II secretion system F family protein [Candidatus Poseidoniaceae archaeon]MDP7000965.1 type II secretion system F family protein [Candidatus Poseidoniaceae archaeon]
MARKKKNKIRVDLDLPKDDTTLTKLYGIIGICMIVGISSMVFWVINTDFIPTQNGQPMFINLYCDHDPRFQPTYAENQSCDILQDTPQPATWTPDEVWRGVSSKAQDFDVPGIDNETIGLYPRSELPQELQLECLVKDSKPVPFTVEIRDPNGRLMTWYESGFKQYSNDTNNAENFGAGCDLVIPDVPPDEGYTIAFLSQDETETLDSVTFTISVLTYDGIPDNMNNKSLWVGPEVDFGVKLRPTIFLNFFGIGIFVMIYPASYYWDKQMKALNEIEEKFPDFLRDLAEYWKGGLSMTIAVQTLANSEYGALNPDVKKMADQISWGIAFEVVITEFANRVGTPLVKRAISLITEANRAGGKISDILVTAANDSREIKFLEGERARAISSYIAVIWVSYMVFLLVIIMMGKVFIPAIAGSNSDDGGDDGGSASIGNMQIRSIDALFFVTIFYYGVTLQALGNGSMAGLMATGRITSGFKHAGMMILVGLFGFNFVVYEPALIGIEPSAQLTTGAGTYSPGPVVPP